MPTTESSNNPHVRITRETHECIRILALLTGYSQGDLVDELVRERLAQMGNPHLQIKLPPRQRRKASLPDELTKTTKSARGVRTAAAEPLPPRRKRLPEPEPAPPARRHAPFRK